MVVVANSSIIRNDVTGDPQNPQFVEMGFDRYSNVRYGNRDFIVNAVLYLTDDEGWINLRSREVKLRMLNKVEVLKGKRFWQVLNVEAPLVLLLLFALIYRLWRRRHWTAPYRPDTLPDEMNAVKEKSSGLPILFLWKNTIFELLNTTNCITYEIHRIKFQPPLPYPDREQSHRVEEHFADIGRYPFQRRWDSIGTHRIRP